MTLAELIASIRDTLREAAAWGRVAGRWPDSAELEKRMKEAEMATGDRMCPNCGQWQVWCKCWLGKIRRGETVGDFPPFEYPGLDWVQPISVTAPPMNGWYTTTTTTIKPRKRRHYRQVVY